MKIIQVVNTLAVRDGGPARNSLELNRHLNQTDWCSADLYWLHGSRAASVLTDYTDDRLPTPGPRKVVWRKDKLSLGARSVTGFIRDLGQADVLIVHGYYLPWVALLLFAAKIGRTRTYVMPHGALTRRQQKYALLKKLLFDISVYPIRKFCLNSFVTGSAQEAEDLKFRFSTSNVQVAGVGVPVVEPRLPDEGFHSPIRLLSISRIAPKKRIDLSIRAVECLRNRGIDAHLTIAGDGDPSLLRTLHELTSELDLGENVTFIGVVVGGAKEDLFRRSDIYLLPSEDENFGISFAEAVSYGLPTVSTVEVAAAQGLPTAAGVILEDSSPENIASSVMELTATRERFERASRSAVVYAETEYTWGAAVQRWRECISPKHV